MAERSEDPEGTVDATLDQPSPAAMALALGRTSRGKTAKGLDTEAEGFLRDQRRLINLQTEHLHEQRAVILARLRLGRWKDRVTLGLQALTGLVGLIVAVALVVMAWQAHEDHSLVIQAFSTPPGFAARGIGGDVVASDVLDRLSSMISVVRSLSFSSTAGATTDTSDDVKIDIPETGVSLAQVQRLLRDWLGSERKVSGNLRDDGDGRITLTARIDSGQAFTAAGSASELGTLEQRVAEQVYETTDPVNFVVYLSTQGRKAEALQAAARNAALPQDREDRANALSLWGELVSDPAEEARMGRIALRIDPGLLSGHFNVMEADDELSHPQDALAHARRMLTLRPSDQPRQHRGQGATQMRAIAHATIDTLTGDFVSATVDRTAWHPSQDARTKLMDAAMDAGRRHDAAASFNLIAEALFSAAPFLGDSRTLELTARYSADVGRGDWAQALADAQALYDMDAKADAASSDPDEKAGFETALDRRDRPMLAETQARTGHLAAAAALISPTPPDCYDCLLARRRIAFLSADETAAMRWLAEAVRQAPSIPFAYADWGKALLARGDISGAIAKLQLAHEKGPHYADPLEVWGEALMAERDYAGAIKKFAEADKDAPKWARNHLRWGEALMLSGRYAEARAQYEAAHGLDLSKPDRAALNVLLARTVTGPLHG